MWRNTPEGPSSNGRWIAWRSRLVASVGAPPDLIGDAQRASLDEIEHAKTAFGLAESLGLSVGPAAFPEAVAPISADPREIVVGLVEEGCIGETLGAAEAFACARVSAPAIAVAHRRIADDEARHAALAYKALNWLLARDPALCEVATETFERVCARYQGEIGVAGALRRACVNEVVRPCARALLARTSKARPVHG